MKKYILSGVILGLVVIISSCSKEVDDEVSGTSKVRMEFRAGIDAVSRTVLTENNEVKWEVDDAISLFDQNSNNRFTTTQSGTSVTFTGSAQDNLETYYALYPYNESATISGNMIITKLPAEQTALAGSFAKMLNPSVAKSGADKLLNFKNACAVVKFTLGAGVTNVVKAMFRGNDGESLAGTLNINVSGNAPVTTVETGEGTGVTLTSNEGFVGTDYYFVVAPLELKKGITLVLYDSSGKEWKRRGGNPVKLTAGHILDLGTITPDEFKEIVHISTADDLVNWSGSSNKLTTDVVLDADIYMDGITWTPVGSSMAAGEGYSGNFDGNGKTIHNLNINNVSGNVGFFGGLAEGGKVHDLKFSDATITGDGSSYAGVVAGANLGIIDNCNVSNSKVSGNNAGAVTGNNSVQVNNCNVQNVTINGNYAGGIAGVNHGKIEYCTVSGSGTNIIATGSNNRAGGIVGSTSEEGSVSTSGRVLKCAVYGVTISGSWSGGIAGENGFGTVAQCVVDECKITHDSSSNSPYLGGVVGYSARGEVVASYSANSTIGKDGLFSEAIGGIVGYNKNSENSPVYIYGCYSTHVSLLGNVSNNNKGAIAGYNDGHVTSCYAILPEGVSEIGLVGRIGTSGDLNNCVNVGENNYETLIENVPDLKDDYGTTWKAVEIWEITASGIPEINTNYIGEAASN